MDNVEVVRQAYAAFGRGDIARILDLLSDDVDWHPLAGLSAPHVPMAGRRKGRQDAAAFFSLLGEHVHFERFDPREFIGQGERVVVLGSYEGRVLKTGGRFACEWAMVFTVHGGRIGTFIEYTDTAAVAAAFGMAV